MTSPFDDESGTFLVLVNEHGQHSLWPASAEQPAGWSIVHGPNDRHSCLEYVTAHWTDMRPHGLATYLDTSI